MRLHPMAQIAARERDTGGQQPAIQDELPNPDHHAQDRPQTEAQPGHIQAASQGWRDPGHRAEQAADRDEQDEPGLQALAGAAIGPASAGPRQYQSFQGCGGPLTDPEPGLIRQERSYQHTDGGPDRAGLMQEMASHQKEGFAQDEQAGPGQGVQKRPAEQDQQEPGVRSSLGQTRHVPSIGGAIRQRYVKRIHAPRRRAHSQGSDFEERIGAGSGNRTRILSLEGCCTTIVLYPPERASPDQGEMVFSQFNRKRREGCAAASSGQTKPDGRRMVEGAGFEPAYAMRADLQSAAFNHSATPPRVSSLRT